MQVEPRGIALPLQTEATTTLWEQISLFLFYTACVHTAFVQPQFVVVPGERSKVLTGIICFVAFAGLALVRHVRNIGSRKEKLVSAGLVTWMFLSSLFSDAAVSSAWRAFVMGSAALGGFWLARALLNTPERRERFTWFCALLMTAILILSVLAQIRYGQFGWYMEGDLHHVADRLLMFLFAPITFILSGKKGRMAFGALLLALMYGVFYASSLRSAMLIPVAMLVLALFVGAIRLKWAVLALVPLIVLLFFFFRSLPQVKMGPQFEPAYYRAEMYPFSLHIAMKHPLLGIGLRAPRNIYLEDYEIKYPYTTKELFAGSLVNTVSSENMYLNFMVDLGFPFFIAYMLVLAALLKPLVRAVRVNPYAGVPPTIALLVSIGAPMLHYMALDGLLHPQLVWYFHILLGMILPVTAGLPREGSVIKGQMTGEPS